VRTHRGTAAARRREAQSHRHEPLLIGVDGARHGDDRTVIFFRRGRDARTIPPIRLRIPDLMQVAPPAAAWSYNNAGFSVSGRVIEAVTGTSINRAIRDLVFTPLGLAHARRFTWRACGEALLAGYRSSV
jgi:CubicO group peptidase (beta-lactamase class C family)